jgi:hypothetical protein
MCQVEDSADAEHGTLGSVPHRHCAYETSRAPVLPKTAHQQQQQQGQQQTAPPPATLSSSSS